MDFRKKAGSPRRGDPSDAPAARLYPLGFLETNSGSRSGLPTKLNMTRAISRFVPMILLVVGAGACTGSALAAPQVASRDLKDLTVLGPNYPRVFFFRAAEGAARRGSTYEAWDAEFSRLMGIMGKCLDEEISETEVHNPEYFTRFKQRHPQQVVLLHFNGRARDPRFHAEQFFPGHWIYRKAVRITANVAAEAGETVIHVRNARIFHVGIGRYKTSNDDIGLFGIAPDGRHDWNHCEQVHLISVDTNANTIRVRRGCFGTTPLAFKAGKARAAAHEASGPWGRDDQLLWLYNFSTRCPKDARGRNCADLLVNDLATWFGPGGKLAALDGVEFDVMLNETHGDTDGDGEMDNGVVDGVNQAGIGMVEFARKLRKRMGENFIIQGDGALGSGGVRSQRAFGLLNGIESEGFPNLNDWEIVDWSGGLNRHNFWRANARPPAFNYINHKWVRPAPGKPGKKLFPEVPFARHRLVFAAAQFTDAMICYSFAPKLGSDGLIGIWDEFWRGTDKKLGWLGRPQGDAMHLATATTDLLSGAGSPAGESLARRIRGPVIVKSDRADGLVLSATKTSASELAFSIIDVPTPGDDLVVQVKMKAALRHGYPKEMARFIHVTAGAAGAHGSEPTSRTQANAGRRGKAQSFVPGLNSSMTWANGRSFTSFFYFRNLKSKSVSLTFNVEGTEPVTLQKIAAYAHPDAMYRVFENGLVLANSGLKPYTFNLRAISPNRRYRRLQGTAGQDIETNNGAPVENNVTLGERDALFLTFLP